MPLHTRYDYNDPEQGAVFLKIKETVEQLFNEGVSQENALIFVEYLGSRLWPDAVTRNLAAGHYRTLKQSKDEAERKSKWEAEQAAKPAPAATVSRPVVRSQTIQGKAAATKRYKKAASETERRWLPEFPGFKIDAKGHVYKPSGEEAAYRFNHKFQKCARVKHEDGDWRELNVYNLMVKAGFEESLQDKRARKNRTPYTGARAWKNHYATIEEAVADGFLDPEDADES